MGVGEYNKKQMQGLHKHKVAFDQEAMWAAMQKKKKKRGAFIFFTMALVALAVVFLSYGIYTYINPMQNHENIQSQNIIPNENQSKSQRNKKLLTANNSQNTTGINNIDPTLADNNNSSDRVAKSSSELVEKEDNVDKPLNTGRRQKHVEATSYRSDDKYTSVSKDNTSATSILTNEGSTTPNDINVQVSTSTTELTTDIDKNTRLDISLLEPDPISLLESLVDPIIELENFDLIPSPIININQSSKSRFHIGAYGGIGYLFRKISLEEQEVLLNDKTLEEISAGLDLKYQIKPNVFIRSGIEYWHGTDRKETNKITVSNLNEIEDLTQFELTEMDQGIIVQSSYSQKHAIYQSINIPLLVGYNTNNSTWNIFAEAGIMYNLLNTSRGELPFDVNESYQIGSRNQISPIAGFGLSYNLSSRIEFYTRLNWRAKQSVTTKISNTNQEYHSLRGQLGFRIGI